LSVTLGIGDMARLSSGTTNLEAYEKYLRARALANSAASPDDLNRAAELLREAISLDPDFAPARGALAGLYVAVLILLPETSAKTLKEMNETVKEALARAPDHWASHMANGVLQLQRHDWHAADAAFAKALSVAPPSELNARGYASLFSAAVGRNADAVKVLEAARSVDPLALGISGNLQLMYYVLGRMSEAEAEYLRSKDLAGAREVSEHLALMRLWDSPDKVAIRAQYRRYLDHQVLPLPVLNQVLEVSDQPEAALKLIGGAFKDPAYQDPSRLMILAWHAAHHGDKELAIAALRRAFVDKQGIYVPAIWYPVLSEARKTSAFKALVRDLGLYDYWRESGKWGDFCHPLGADDFACQ
jgi:tetratricopeptide (TPR) repeat protein